MVFIVITHYCKLLYRTISSCHFLFLRFSIHNDSNKDFFSIDLPSPNVSRENIILIIINATNGLGNATFTHEVNVDAVGKFTFHHYRFRYLFTISEASYISQAINCLDEIGRSLTSAVDM